MGLPPGRVEKLIGFVIVHRQAPFLVRINDNLPLHLRIPLGKRAVDAEERLVLAGDDGRLLVPAAVDAVVDELHPHLRLLVVDADDADVFLALVVELGELAVEVLHARQQLAPARVIQFRVIRIAQVRGKLRNRPRSRQNGLFGMGRNGSCDKQCQHNQVLHFGPAFQ